MKVFFEDGALGAHENQLPCKPDVRLDAGIGLSECEHQLREALDSGKKYVYTNYTDGMSPSYCWDFDNNICDLYFYSPKHNEWIVADVFTDSKLSCRKVISKMYLGGLFTID